jgi:hypothetical protein
VLRIPAAPPRWTHGLLAPAIRFRERKNAHRPAGEVFSEVYSNKLWGAGPEPYWSGEGSRNDAIVAPYLDIVSRRLSEIGRDSVGTTVDLGCGDFVVGSRLVGVGTGFIACDVVPELIESHRIRYQRLPVEFLVVDLTTDPLPAGNTAFLRQVLQHLSNRQISAVLPKLRIYDRVIITEHHPYPDRVRAPNLDKNPGGSTRLKFGSGVYLSEAPFNLPRTSLRLLLEVPIADGVVRSWEYMPRQGA